MDGLERKEALAAMKAKADEVLAERQKKVVADRKMFVMGLEARKTLAMVDHTMKVLDTPSLRPLRTMENRPGEKVALKAKGIAKGKRKTPGMTGPSM